MHPMASGTKQGLGGNGPQILIPLELRFARSPRRSGAAAACTATAAAAYWHNSSIAAISKQRTVPGADSLEPLATCYFDCVQSVSAPYPIHAEVGEVEREDATRIKCLS